MKSKPLSPAKQTFVNEYIKCDNATESVRRAFPELLKAEGESEHYLEVKANRLMRNDEVQLAINNQKQKLVTIANRAVKRVEQLVESDNEKIATQNVWQVIDHVHGKAIQQIQSTSQSVQFNIDLTSSLTDEPSV
jgi:phage terminase small subunit